MRGLTITPVRNSEIRGLRIMFLCMWIVTFGVLPWLFWLDKDLRTFSVLWPIGLTLLSILAGWFLGYKRLIGFWGFVLKDKPDYKKEFLEYLGSLKDQSSKNIHLDAGINSGSFSIADMINEIENETPCGKYFLDMYRENRSRK